MYGAMLHPLLLRDRLPFLPLLLTSTYCAAGVTWVWLVMAWSYLSSGLGAGSKPG